MKKLSKKSRSTIAVAIFLFLPVLYSSSAHAYTPSRQTAIYSFFKSVKRMIATCAHPTADYVSSDVSVSGYTANISIVYRSKWNGNRIYTNISIGVDSDGDIRGIEVTSDTAFMPAFATLSIIKEIATEYITENNDESKESEHSAIAKYIKSRWDSLSGKDLCYLLLKYQWVKNGYKTSF